MVYCFLGEDTLAKDQKILEIKRKYLTATDSLTFDWEVLHANKLDPADFKKSLAALPVLAAKRVVVLRLAEKLSPANKDLIREFFKEKKEHVILVLDSNELKGEDRFWETLRSALSAKIEICSQKTSTNVFDMTKAIGASDSREALKLLNNLFNEGQHPLQIIGVLVWFWGNKMKAKVSGEDFKKGLLILQEADLNIKRSRLDPEHAIETAVVKLTEIISAPYSRTGNASF